MIGSYLVDNFDETVTNERGQDLRLLVFLSSRNQRRVLRHLHRSEPTVQGVGRRKNETIRTQVWSIMLMMSFCVYANTSANHGFSLIFLWRTVDENLTKEKHKNEVSISDLFDL